MIQLKERDKEKRTRKIATITTLLYRHSNITHIKKNYGEAIFLKTGKRFMPSLQV